MKSVLTRVDFPRPDSPLRIEKREKNELGKNEEREKKREEC